ncbi:hypothetical protein NEUTE1DRAFT_114943 [Neurospora tetrasperma FGSC 2508]|uniref:Secreted protein n=1 Tax=Neurospora tetrasperma (strain FGSC 2508 / ATCC MYA-4615 / P0657) TaxID=510951 RepID=F8N150_NEUT8|nr:uncharacterized protein NEUTE1DRAFT_114943 [Neurospora tetrasperma FGSC 2508]EGO53083.1 hypothetical protein NEUTE1DRAFT_114943 [Neurospora tetrasperma FGSC 2508]
MLAWVIILKITLSGYFLGIVENIPGRSRSAQLVPVSDQGSCDTGEPVPQRQGWGTYGESSWVRHCLVDEVFDKTKSLWHLDQRSEDKHFTCLVLSEKSFSPRPSTRLPPLIYHEAGEA